MNYLFFYSKFNIQGLIKIVLRYISFIDKYKITVVSIMLLFFVFAGYNLKNINVENDYRIYFSSDNPELIALNILEKSFGLTDNVVSIVQQNETDYFTEDFYKSITTDYAFEQTTLNEMTSIIPLSYSLMLIFLMLVIRNIMAMIYTILVILISIITAFGIFAYLGIPLNSVIAFAPLMIMILATANCVHFFNCPNYTDANDTNFDRMVATLTMKSKQIIVTTLTTIVGLLSLNFSDSPLFQNLGNLVAVALLTVLLWLSALLLYKISLVKTDKKNSLPKILKVLPSLIAKYPAPILSLVGLVMAFSVFFAMKNEPSEIFVNYFDHSYEIRRSIDLIGSRLTGGHEIDYIFGYC